MNKEGVRVESVARGSPAERAGIREGDRILSVSGVPASDLLDLHFLTAGKSFRLEWRDSGGARHDAKIRPGGRQLGIFPEPVRVRRCRNRCIFCFVRQMPKGLRRSLYIRDEDVRMSFLHGQYVTFSDATEEELRKILRYRLSPLYVSIHTTDPALRHRMLGNPAAADILQVMRRLVDGGITLHGQIVACPGINDGKELERTLRSLQSLRPGLSSVSVVPVGLTEHREGLPYLRSVTREEARRTLSLLGRIRKETAGGDEPFAMAADEYYLLAGERIPGTGIYGSFAQIENGVGLLRRFLDEAAKLFRRRRWRKADAGGIVVTGLLPRRHISDFLREYSRRSGRSFTPVPAENRLFGKSVTVTGLLGGRDILAALGPRKGSRIFLPSVTLRDAGDLFLDGLAPGDIEKETGAVVTVFPPSPAGFHDAVYNG